MARDHSRMNLAIWQDDDWLDLPRPAQHLYFTLWNHPELSYAGVVDWRPGRLAHFSGGTTANDIRAAAACLQARMFVIVDEGTEECLIRSWVRFDGLIKSAVMAVSFANAYAATASRTLKGVIVHQTIRLKELEPNLVGWDKPQVQEVLTKRSIDPRTLDMPADPLAPGLTPGLTPSLTPSVTVKAGVGVNPSPNPSPTPAPAPAPFTPAPSPSRRKPESALPDDWEPNDNHREQARAHHSDINYEAKRFRNHAEANDRRQRNWDAAFRNWLDSPFSQAGKSQAPKRRLPPELEWMANQ